ncbi:TonB-dependent hemoglobin/transferrin/lactoferrin family receptor [Undibacterium squillarum]|uniref:TonB-dependent hemoglobin/transferrin/lactoferrin family receptor n=1 Tax=Undibacterium squillarum TaxID=1131567 RepID=UPI0035B35C54
MIQKTSMAAAVALALSPFSAPVYGADNTITAQELEQAQKRPEQILQDIHVRTTRSAGDRSQQAVTVTQSEPEQIERAQTGRLADLFSMEPDLSVRAATPRFTAAGSAFGRAGQESINIRGLEDNQVLLMSDGVPLPNSFSFGAFSTGRGAYLNTDALKSVEVLRGPASMQHGSDGLAGAVSFRTIEPDDFLSEKQRFGGFLRSGYSSLDRSWFSSGAVVWQAGDVRNLVFVSRRTGHEVANQGDDASPDSRRTKPNPTDTSGRYLLAKSQWQADAQHRLGITLEALRQETDSNVLSGRATAPYRSNSVIGLTAEDETQRDKIAFEHRWQPAGMRWLQQADSRLSFQKSSAHQLSVEDRYSDPDRVRDNRYENRGWHFSSTAQGEMAGVPVSYGLDWSRTQASALRGGVTAPAGETFPSKPFPDTQYTVAGAFWQGDWQAGAFRIQPGVRLDHYKLSPDAAGYSGKTVTLSDQAVSPRLGLVWQLQKAHQTYFQIAKGFRAPSPDQVNNGFSNPVMGYETRGNADLRPETAHSLELGMRGQIKGLRYQWAMYRNTYDDFIKQQVTGGSGRPGDPMIFQYINLAQATIRGAELRLDWQLDPVWRVQGAWAQGRGETTQGSQRDPLETINPARLQTTLHYNHDALSGWLQIQHQRGKALADIPVSTTPAFAPPSFTTLDIGAAWKLAQGWTLQAQISNLTDRKYWRWADVRGVADNSSVKDAYTAPGRQFLLSLRYDFRSSHE